MLVYSRVLRIVAKHWGRIELFALFVAACFSASDLLAQPALRSICPSAAQQGAAISVEFRGTNLEGAYAVWSDTQGVEGEVKPAAPPSQPADADAQTTQPAEPIIVQLRVDPAAQSGPHQIRLVTPRGLSNALSIFRDGPSGEHRG